VALIVKAQLAAAAITAGRSEAMPVVPAAARADSDGQPLSAATLAIPCIYESIIDESFLFA
jgi:hypothetical protein